MTLRNFLTQNRLKECVSYDPASGIFLRILCRGKCSSYELKAKDAYGYISMYIDNVRHVGHRLAWLYMNGSFPEGSMDHMNGNRSDNRFSNLRLASLAQNCQNAKLRSDSGSGLKGVSLRRNGKWIARIAVDNKNITLGTFSSNEEAYAKYCEAAAQLHGDFANTGKPTDFDYNDFDVRR